jgi:AcrR family transcriptional regulator
MNQVAQRAGVGPGTLYRNYPTREALVLAVYQSEVEQLAGSVPGLLATLPPLEALRRWTADLVSAMRRKHGLGDALSPGAHRSITEQAYGPVIAAIARPDAVQRTAGFRDLPAARRRYVRVPPHPGADGLRGRDRADRRLPGEGTGRGLRAAGGNATLASDPSSRVPPRSRPSGRRGSAPRTRSPHRGRARRRCSSH